MGNNQKKGFYKMTAKDRVRMALDSAAAGAGGERAQTLVFRFRLDKNAVKVLGHAKGSAQAQDEGIQPFACDGTKGHDTPLEDCKAQNPMFCPYHGITAMVTKLSQTISGLGSVTSLDKDSNGVFTLTVSASTDKDVVHQIQDKVNQFLSQPGFKKLDGKSSYFDDGSSETKTSFKTAAGQMSKHDMLDEWTDAIVQDAVDNEGHVDDGALAEYLAKKEQLDQFKAELDFAHQNPEGLDAADLHDAEEAYKNLLAEVEADYHKLSALSEFADVDDLGGLGAAHDQAFEKVNAAKEAVDALHKEKTEAMAKKGWKTSPIGFPGNDEYGAAKGAFWKDAQSPFLKAEEAYKEAKDNNDIVGMKVALHNMNYFADKAGKVAEAMKAHAAAMVANYQKCSGGEKAKGKNIDEKKAWWEQMGIAYPEALKAVKMAVQQDGKSAADAVAAGQDAAEAGKTAPEAPAKTSSPKSATAAAAKPAEPAAPGSPLDATKLQPLLHDESKFPASLSMKQILAGKKMSGGSGNAVYKVTIGDRTYAAKVASAGKKAAFLRNEMAFDRAYRDAGIRVPDFKEYEVDGKTVKLAEFIDGKLLGNCSKNERAAAKKDLLAGFALDAAFSNWDVLGTGLSNVIVDKDGHCWRIDNGGAGKYDAHGNAKELKSNYMSEFHEGGDIDSPKTVSYEDWKDGDWANREWPDDWRTMRRAAINEGMFDFTTHEIFDAATHIDFKAAVKNLPSDAKKALIKPMAEIREMATHAAGLQLAGYAKMTSYSVWNGKEGSGKSYSQVEIDPCSTALDSLYDSAKQGIRPFLQNKLDYSNSAWAKGSASSQSVYTPVPYSSVKPEPVEPKPPTEGQDYAQAVFAAVKSVNYHVDQGDNKPNATSVAAAKAAKPALQELANAGNENAKALLGIIGEVEKAEKKGFKAKIVNPGSADGFYDFGALKTIANQAEIDAAKASLKPKHDAWVKEHAQWMKEKAVHDAGELSKAKASGGAPTKSFEKFKEQFIESNVNTDGIAQGGGTNEPNEESKSSQKTTSFSTDSCKKKVRQYAMMGISLETMRGWKNSDPVFYNGHTDNGGSHVSGSDTDEHNFYEAVEFYAKNPETFRQHMESYARHKALIYAMHYHGINPAIDKESGTVFVIRKEHKEAFGLHGKGAPTGTKVIKPYPIDSSCSAGYNSTGCLGDMSIGWRMPLWRISDTWVHTSGSECEININPIKIPFPPMHFAKGGSWESCMAKYDAQPEVAKVLAAAKVKFS